MLMMSGCQTTQSTEGTNWDAEQALWGSAYDQDNKKRFIPVQLWTGGSWDSQHQITTPLTNFQFGSRNHKRTEGPFDWINPITNKPSKMYKRFNNGKIQFFTIREDQTGLGRSYDNRWSLYCADEAKFPLGWWMEGEERTFTYQCTSGENLDTYTVKLTIDTLDYTYQGRKHALKYSWKLFRGDSRVDSKTYIYAPHKGMVEVW
ncbi:hypothetical protein BEN30_07430 [Magnetovibrio blakemorei]|uniref:Uncharacterized protein n=2 Tax=Magnetovibrio blakemorei TaxID=28181 RepID=A0A1E5Q9I9_9PROT|nr:hypothetical protein BEN30_07430 [Magnetovibrio blakemorei]